MMTLAEEKVAYRSGESALTGVLVYGRAVSEPCPGIVMGPTIIRTGIKAIINLPLSW